MTTTTTKTRTTPRSRNAGRTVAYTRSAGAAAAVALTLAGCTSHAAPKNTARPVEKIVVLTGFNVTGQDAYLYVGIERGIFAAAGLEVSVQPGSGTGTNLKLLRAGQVAFAVLDMTGALIELHGERADVRVFTALYQRSVSCIMAPTSRGIIVPRDLEGKRVGFTPGGVNYTLFPTYARLANVDATKVRWVSMPPPNLRPTLIAGQVDAITEIVIGRPAVELAAGGAQMTVLPYSDYLGDLYGNVMATRLETAMCNPALVKRFRDAMLDALLWTIEHPDEAGAILAKHQQAYKAEAAAAEIRALTPYVRPAGALPIGSIEAHRLMRSISLLQAAGAIPATGLQPEHLVSFDLTPSTPAAHRPGESIR